ncbi:MAG: Ig-like domain-containing protein [Lishizhenia sp.]
MRNVKHTSITLLLLVLISACAQVGTITGGLKDIYAPKPISEKTLPPNASTTILPNQIRIPFDEYIKLNSPASTIRITPNTLDLKTTIKNKTLIIDLKGEYLENTTYSIQFNRAIQDITENNDSIFSYVFSTGSEIDKNRASFSVTDGFKNTALPNITVGLFEELITRDSLVQPLYQTATTEKGKANFNFIKSGNYFVYAYEDKDKNGTISLGERAGVIDTLYIINDTIELNSEIKISDQPTLFKLSTAYENPSTFKIWGSEDLDTAQLKFLQPLPDYIDYSDTIYAYYKNTNNSVIKIRYAQDTLSKRTKKENIKLVAKNNLINKHLPYETPFSLNFNDVVKEIEYNKILLNGKAIDSTFIQKLKNQLTISFESEPLPDSTKIIFLPNALQFLNLEQKDSLIYEFTKQSAKDVGNLKVIADSIFKKGILQLLLNDKVIQEQRTTPETKTVFFKNLQPNSYSFRFIEDYNDDGKWTPGNIYTKQQPETMIYFKSTSKVRANWDIEVKLQFVYDK